MLASFIGSAGDVVSQNANFVTLKKEVVPRDNAAFSQSGMVKITLTPSFSPDAPKGAYELADRIPSGLRFVACEQNYENNWFLNDREGQNMSFTVLNSDKHAPSSITHGRRFPEPSFPTAPSSKAPGPPPGG